jgi:DNA-binding beta-propeller fold protein YncE
MMIHATAAKVRDVAGLTAVVVVVLAGVAPRMFAQRPADGMPVYQVDPSWPKFEGNWTFGSIGGVFVDPTNDHVWVLNRPRTLKNDENYAVQQPRAADCCVPPAFVQEFDQDGKALRSWGGPGPGYEWPANEHGLSIDVKGNFWLGGNGKGDAQILKFSKDGRFLLQIGHSGKSNGSNDTATLASPTKATYYAKTNEVFISDGYINRRVVVFDADTGQYKRHWGAYGKKPDDAAPRTLMLEGPLPEQFTISHDVQISTDDLVYVADRSNNRLQVFRPDGTFVKEAFVAREVRVPAGTVVTMAFSADKEQRFLYVTGGDQRVRILDRQTLQVIGSFGRLGHYAGQFDHITDIAVDSKGNIYTGENDGHRVQKWTLKNTPPNVAW